mmetsp:Transcript_153392/g.268174  ORF Transcript_153392/g.268174 Transcript_153392/m.268174 type:complete len:1075 (-) Transcript_153392:1627-4851(-)
MDREWGAPGARGGILASEMGTGKSRIMLALIHNHPAPGGWAGSDAARHPATPLVVPPHLVGQWRQELAVFAPQLRVVEALHGEEWQDFGARRPPSDLVITTFDVLQGEYHKSGMNVRTRSGRQTAASPLHTVHWWRLVVDEAQEVTYLFRHCTQLLRNATAESRWSVSGTPFTEERGLRDLEHHLKFLDHPEAVRVEAAMAEYQRTRSSPFLVRFLRSCLWRQTKAMLTSIDIPAQEGMQVDLRGTWAHRRFLALKKAKLETFVRMGAEEAAQREMAELLYAVFDPSFAFGYTGVNMSGHEALAHECAQDISYHCREVVLQRVSPPNGRAGRAALVAKHLQLLQVAYLSQKRMFLLAQMDKIETEWHKAASKAEYLRCHAPQQVEERIQAEKLTFMNKMEVYGQAICLVGHSAGSLHRLLAEAVAELLWLSHRDPKLQEKIHGLWTDRFQDIWQDTDLLKRFQVPKQQFITFEEFEHEVTDKLGDGGSADRDTLVSLWLDRWRQQSEQTLGTMEHNTTGRLLECLRKLMVEAEWAYAEAHIQDLEYVAALCASELSKPNVRNIARTYYTNKEKEAQKELCQRKRQRDKRLAQLVSSGFPQERPDRTCLDLDSNLLEQVRQLVVCTARDTDDQNIRKMQSLHNNIISYMEEAMSALSEGCMPADASQPSSSDGGVPVLHPPALSPEDDSLLQHFTGLLGGLQQPAAYGSVQADTSPAASGGGMPSPGPKPEAPPSPPQSASGSKDPCPVSLTPPAMPPGWLPGIAPALLDGIQSWEPHACAAGLSAKERFMLQFVRHHRQQGSKVVIVSGLQRMLQKVKHLLRTNMELREAEPDVFLRKSYEYFVHVEGKHCPRALERFHANSGVGVLLLHARSGSGLTLNHARHILLLDLLPVPLEQQVRARNHRLGQTEGTTFTRLVLMDSVEELLLQYYARTGNSNALQACKHPRWELPELRDLLGIPAPSDIPEAPQQPEGEDGVAPVAGSLRVKLRVKQVTQGKADQKVKNEARELDVPEDSARPGEGTAANPINVDAVDTPTAVAVTTPGPMHASSAHKREILKVEEKHLLKVETTTRG